MHPNAFLKSLWRSEIKDQVFVAMSFEPRFTTRFNKIIKPAIETKDIAGYTLKAFRVDNSKTGDSILTEIVNGIAFSRLVLADVSVIDEGRYAETSIRNGNVMYEVGVALACRNPSEVLLIRDDVKKFLFDVSTIPHMQIDFSKPKSAITELRKAISDRLSESKLIEDARVKMAGQALTQDEIRILRKLAQLKPDQAADISHPEHGMLTLPDAHGLDALIRKGCIVSHAVNSTTGTVYHALNPFGYALAAYAEKMLLMIASEGKKPKKSKKE